MVSSLINMILWLVLIKVIFINRKAWLATCEFPISWDVICLIKNSTLANSGSRSKSVSYFNIVSSFVCSQKTFLAFKLAPNCVGKYQ